MKTASRRDRPATENADNREWYEACYEQIVADKTVQAQAFSHAQRMRGSDDPEITMSDVQASRAYLRTCVLNMSVSELLRKRTGEFAALWARGTLGAAKYRSGSGRSKVKRRSPRASSENDD